MLIFITSSWQFCTKLRKKKQEKRIITKSSAHFTFTWSPSLNKEQSNCCATFQGHNWHLLTTASWLAGCTNALFGGSFFFFSLFFVCFLITTWMTQYNSGTQIQYTSPHSYLLALQHSSSLQRDRAEGKKHLVFIYIMCIKSGLKASSMDKACKWSSFVPIALICQSIILTGEKFAFDCFILIVKSKKKICGKYYQEKVLHQKVRPTCDFRLLHMYYLCNQHYMYVCVYVYR